MKPSLSQMAVMNVEEGEEIVGGWATPQIPGTGIYKLLAKKRKDGVIKWAHFIQRDNGSKERVMRGRSNHMNNWKRSLKLPIGTSAGFSALNYRLWITTFIHWMESKHRAQNIKGNITCFPLSLV